MHAQGKSCKQLTSIVRDNAVPVLYVCRVIGHVYNMPAVIATLVGCDAVVIQVPTFQQKMPMQASKPVYCQQLCNFADTKLCACC